MVAFLIAVTGFVFLIETFDVLAEICDTFLFAFGFAAGLIVGSAFRAERDFSAFNVFAESFGAAFFIIGFAARGEVFGAGFATALIFSTRVCLRELKAILLIGFFAAGCVFLTAFT